MEEGNLILVVVAGIGFMQVAFAAILAYLNNRAAARKDNESVYAGLVDRLQKQLASSYERNADLEEKCEKYEQLLEECGDDE